MEKQSFSAAKIASALHNSSKGTSSQDSWGFASLKLGISDSIVERLGRQSTSQSAKKIPLQKRNSRFEKFDDEHLLED